VNHNFADVMQVSHIIVCLSAAVKVSSKQSYTCFCVICNGMVQIVIVVQLVIVFFLFALSWVSLAFCFFHKMTVFEQQFGMLPTVTSLSVLMCAPVKVTLNVRIVVVGASEVGISFLETFAFWYVTTLMHVHFCEL